MIPRLWRTPSALVGSARARRPILVAAGLIVLTVSLALFANAVHAATYRNWVAQQASQPVPGQVVRVWVDSDTAFGETAGLEYHAGSSFVRVYGTFDTSYPGANWRIDIPASVQTSGAFVEYQLFTRNQSNQDYGFTGFNWNYTVTDIHWNELKHDTFTPSTAAPLARSRPAPRSRSASAPPTITSPRSACIFTSSTPTTRRALSSTSTRRSSRTTARMTTGRRSSRCRAAPRSGITSGSSSAATTASTAARAA